MYKLSSQVGALEAQSKSFTTHREIVYFLLGVIVLLANLGGWVVRAFFDLLVATTTRAPDTMVLWISVAIDLVALLSIVAIMVLVYRAYQNWPGARRQDETKR